MDTVLSVVNLVFGITIFVLNVLYYRRCRASWRWVKLMYSVIGLLYTALYLVVLFDAVPDSFADVFMTSFVRPLITITLGTILAGSILTVRRGGPDEC